MTRTKSLTFLGLLVLLAIAASGSAPPINAALPPTSASPEGRIALRPFDDAEPEPISSPLTSTVYLPLIMQEMYVYLPMVLTTSPLQQPLPADGQRDVSANTYLGWQFSDARAAGATFTIYFEIDDPTPDTVLATGLTTSVYALPTTLALGAHYSWQIVARRADGTTVIGPIWQFQTEAAGLTPDLNAVVHVPAGTFFMGCDQSNPVEDLCSYNIYHHPEPVRPIYVDAFEIDKYEVTNQEYAACLKAGACSPPRETKDLNNPARALRPVAYVSWWNAQAFCAWDGKRLPTEAEWEKAGRGPLDTRKWPWGNEAPDCSRVNSAFYMTGNCPERTKGITQVGLFPRGASPYGAHDMAGNIFEWVQDKYDVTYYLYGPLSNPQGPPFSRVTIDYEALDKPPKRDELGIPFFTIRGGSWRDNPTYLRISHRHWGHHGDDGPNTDVPYFRNDKVGFRCARSATDLSGQ